MTSEQLLSALSDLYWSQAELSRRTGVSTQSVNAWAKGTTPVPSWLDSYLSALIALRNAAISCGACSK
jgi:transcriptional regulator with XRE-family HTH domain